METRKVQLAGRSTFTVSLPKDWATEHGFEPGTRVHLYPHIDGSLVLRESAETADDPCEATVAVSDHEGPALRRAVQALYAGGADRLVIEAADGFSGAQRAGLVGAARDLIGLTVVEETAERLEVETMLDAAEVSVVQSVLQLQFVAVSMQREATAALLAADAEGARQVADRRSEARGLAQLVRRHFKRSLTDLAEVDRLGLRRPELFELIQSARLLDRIAGCATTIAGPAGRLEGPVEGDTADRFEALNAEARRLVQAASDGPLGDGDEAAALDVLDAATTLEAEVEAFQVALEGDGPADAARLVPAVCGLRDTAAAASDIAAVTVGAAARPDGG